MTQEEIDALPDEFELVLPKPVEAAGISYAKLTFREPTAGQLEDASRHGNMRGVIILLALSAGVPPTVIDKLPARALKRATAFIESFSEDVQPTG